MQPLTRSFQQKVMSNEVGINARGLAQSVRRWLRRRAYVKRLQRAKRAKGRARSIAADDLRLGKH